MILVDITIQRSAVISTCGNYRYLLERRWDENRPPYVLGMLNPSTADANVDDSTITVSMRRAMKESYGSLVVWNLGAGRATDPKRWMDMEDPVGPENGEYVSRALNIAKDCNGIAVVGWGVYGGFRGLDKEAFGIAQKIGVQLWCLGITRGGHPRHPLHVPYLAKPRKWSWPHQSEMALRRRGK